MKNNWVIKKLTPGDQIRVARKGYYHHGIYIGNDEVIHYTSLLGDIANPNDIKVMKTSLDFFLKDGYPEVRAYTLKEKCHLRNKKEIINLAISKIGEGEYDFIHHNCEHFSNECAFKIMVPTQIDDMKESIHKRLKKL